MRTSQDYLFRACYNKGVSNHPFFFFFFLIETQMQPREVGKLYPANCQNLKASGMLWLKVVDMRKQEMGMSWGWSREHIWLFGWSFIESRGKQNREAGNHSPWLAILGHLLPRLWVRSALSYAVCSLSVCISASHSPRFVITSFAESWLFRKE